MYKLANAADITPAQVREFFHQHYLPYAKSYKRSWATDVSYYETHINDLIGERHMDSVSKQDVIAVMNKASQRLSPTSSYRLLVLLRYMFNLAIRWNIGSIKVNPTQHHTLPRFNNNCERYLSKLEIQQLLAAINQSRNTVLKYIIPMLLLTGARKRD